MANSKNAENSEYVITNLLWTECPLQNVQNTWHIFSGNGKENFPKLNFIQALNLGLKISFCFFDDFGSDLPIAFSLIIIITQY